MGLDKCSYKVFSNYCQIYSLMNYLIEIHKVPP